MSDSEQLVLTEIRGTTGIIRLNRPAKRNALSLGLLHAVAGAVQDYVRGGQVRAIVLTGSDTVFSAGADLNEALEMTTAQSIREYTGAFRAAGQVVERAPIATIAAISGWCMTGGLELAMMCDIRLAAPSARFAITSARIGSVAGFGGTQRLPRLVGPARAKELLFTCDTIDAGEAARIGLVNHMVSDGPVLDAALAMAERIGQRGPLSIGWAKAAVDFAMNSDLDSGLTFESHLVAGAFLTEDRAEGMGAFLEKRPAQFKGR